MNYVKYTYIDSVTRVSVAQEPAINGPAMPDIKGLEFGFALESEYPTNTPIMYGICTTLDDIAPGLLEVITRAEFDSAKTAEMEAREAKDRVETKNNIAEQRWRCEVSGVVFYGREVETDRATVAMLSGAALAASLDASYSARWKTVDGFMTLSSAQIIELAQTVRQHVQSCFDREAELLDALDGGFYEGDMLSEGWPSIAQSA